MTTFRLGLFVVALTSVLMLDNLRASVMVFTPIGDPLAGEQGTQAFGVSGTTVVGNYFDSGNNSHAFMYDGGQYSTLTPPGSSNAWAMGVDGNNVVGVYDLASSSTISGFLYNGLIFTTLNDPIADQVTGTQAEAVSGNMVVGGVGYDGHGNAEGFIYDGSSYTNVAYPGAVSTNFTGISGNKIVGTYRDTSGNLHSFVYNGTAFTPISDPLGVSVTHAEGIFGDEIVGNYVDQNKVVHGFFYDGTVYTTIDDPLGVGTTTLRAIDGNVIVIVVG